MEDEIFEEEFEQEEEFEEEQNIDCDNTDEIVCPHCGYTHGDSWDISADRDEMQCHSCYKEFTFERIVSVSYCTWKVNVK
jgi:transposase-like protein